MDVWCIASTKIEMSRVSDPASLGVEDVEGSWESTCEISQQKVQPWENP